MVNKVERIWISEGQAMAMELDDELDLREVRRGEFELVAVFRDLASGESLKLNLDQVNRVLGGDLNEVHDADLTKDALLQGRNALMRTAPSGAI